MAKSLTHKAFLHSITTRYGLRPLHRSHCSWAAFATRSGLAIRTILIQFLVETVVMGILGGMAGPVAGFTNEKVLAHFTRRGTVISPLVMIVAVGFSGAVGVFFGYYPALNPIEALRYE